jgi:Rrf2 family protein
MRLTRAACYAIHAVAFIAQQKKDQTVPSHLIAAKRNISDRFLLKVLKPLVTAQVLTSVKGPHGGYKLARPASEITMLEVVEAVEGPIRGDAPTSIDEPTHPVNKRLDAVCSQAAEQLRRQLARVKISELSGKD